MDHKLTDLIDIEKTQRLLENFLSAECTCNPTGFSYCYEKLLMGCASRFTHPMPFHGFRVSKRT
ncbi:MAG: hypothetical protein ABSH41_18855 [Syntrophobacteraceae bacterium]